jgi:hypothetical protein
LSRKKEGRDYDAAARRLERLLLAESCHLTDGRNGPKAAFFFSDHRLALARSGGRSGVFSLLPATVAASRLAL